MLNKKLPENCDKLEKPLSFRLSFTKFQKLNFVPKTNRFFRFSQFLVKLMGSGFWGANGF
jgi:hypothetical protein